MKKGFFLLEALLACVLIALLVGAIMHYHAQWSLCYKRSLDRSKALAKLMAHIEQRKSFNQRDVIADECKISIKNVSIPVSVSSDGRYYPPAHCMQISLSWNDPVQGTCEMSAIMEGNNGS